MSTAAYLDSLLGLYTPSDYDRHLASVHREQLESAVRRSLGAIGLFETGSWTHGTAVKGHSDVDYFAVLPERRLSAEGVLLALSQSMKGTFPKAIVRINRPAVSVKFERGPSIEVTPALTDSNGFIIPRYEGDGWMPSNPVKHAEYVNRARDKYPKAKSFIRLVKTWKFRNDVPITSLYLEMKAAQYLLSEPGLEYVEDLCRLLEELWACGLASMSDPSQFLGADIPAHPSGVQRGRALHQIDKAVGIAQKARYANRHNGSLATLSLRFLFKND